MGPLFFIIYINDIVADINSSIKLFQDDTSLYMIVDDPVDAAETLNTDLAKIHDWSISGWLNLTLIKQKVWSYLGNLTTHFIHHYDG